VENDAPEQSVEDNKKPAAVNRAKIPGRTLPVKAKKLDSVEVNSEFVKRNQVNEISNPYVKILRLDDLLDTLTKEKREITRSNIEIVMLRYNTMFVNLYKIYKENIANINHYSFTLKLRVFWQFLRDCRILTPGLSLA
jgi:hypothetical protein